MSKQRFDVLVEMGFEDPYEIEKFSCRTEGDTDILKIYLHRHQGEWFSKSKKFKFKRVDKSLEMGTPYGTTTEPSSYFLRALAELEKLVKVEKDVQSRKELLLAELAHLETVTNRKIEDIRRQIEQL